MLNKFLQQFLSQRRFESSLVGGVLTLGFAISSVGLETQISQSQEPPADATTMALAQIPASYTLAPDGVYLFGRSSEPEQIGEEYVVFEAKHGKIVGAVYWPASEFSCFSGTAESNQLNLTVVDPYDQTTYAHSIALEQESSIASADSQLQTQNQYQLQGYKQIPTISENDQRILGTCKATYE